ncbi:MAG: hypothetical protein HYT50_02465 [Candidatus Wildermuthbacteria bacterium]|nr:hypothetical protein [Candidatus Wildermuthbacteria bacterium]
MKVFLVMGAILFVLLWFLSLVSAFMSFSGLARVLAFVLAAALFLGGGVFVTLVSIQMLRDSRS